ncbi:MAG: hypothetical protein HW394_1808 [Acidobacteria bacterium]|nr:hypothetical protein [Acidobacteriota bacterium]
MRKLLVVSIAAVGLTLSLLVQMHAQGGVGQIQVGGSPTVPDAQAAGPVPRLPDGTVDITGPWVGGGSNANIERDGGLKPGELPLLPWAKALRDKREDKDEPYTACLPMSVPRVNPYPWKFALSYTSKGLTHIYVLHETGDAGAHRVVYMDGRKHPEDPLPTWWGHSIGRFEKDTLVIDTVGYNDKFWFDSVGTPHTEQLHTVERWTRINYGRITNDFLLDDPGAFSRPVNLKFTGRLLRPDLKTGGGDLMEFICLEGNEYGAAGGFTPGGGTSIK